MVIIIAGGHKHGRGQCPVVNSTSSRQAAKAPLQPQTRATPHCTLFLSHALLGAWPAACHAIHHPVAPPEEPEDLCSAVYIKSPCAQRLQRVCAGAKCCYYALPLPGMDACFVIHVLCDVAVAWWW